VNYSKNIFVRQPLLRCSVSLFALSMLLSLVGCNVPTFASSSQALPTLTSVPIQLPTLTPNPTSTPEPTMTPTATAAPRIPIRAMRLDYKDYAASRAEVDNLEILLRQSGINLVALGAGRVDWTYFKWTDRPENWSSDVTSTGIDFLAQDAARFHAFAQVDAVVDVYAPKYIQTHPQSATLSWLGQPSPYLVNTMDLVDGEFGQLLLDMIDKIAANYPVDSISLTELMYYTDGYGDVDKVAYMNNTGKKDWPRLSNGLVNIDDPSIGEWRSHEIARFLGKARAITAKYGKRLFVDAAVTWKSPESLGADHGTRYDILLEQADRVVIWDYFALNGYRPEFSQNLAELLVQKTDGRAILSIGLWAKNDQTITPAQLEAAILSAQKGGMQDIWITPSLLMTDAHWEVLRRLWGSSLP
jgi:hypothetical protein